MTAATADPNGGGLTDEQAAVYDRQLRVWGVEAQKRMGASTFFVLGDLDGVAAEACKNIVLAGVGTLRIWDNGMDAHDANAPPGNFLATAGAAGKAAGSITVARAMRDTLQEMNPFCFVECRSDPGVALPSAPLMDVEFRAGVDAVLYSGASLSDAIEINASCRRVGPGGVAFFHAHCRASTAHFFVDLGDAFEHAPDAAPGSGAFSLTLVHI